MPAVIAADPLGVLVAFGAGILSFLSPCVLPLVPGYVSMVSGLSAAQLESGERRDLRALLSGIGLFVAGFTVVFTIEGAIASSFGRLLENHHRGLQIGFGVVVCVLGAWLALGAPSALLRERRFHPRPSQLGMLAAPIMGMAFAFGWTPCIGPVLSGVLGLAADRGSLVSGMVLLAVYSLGLGVPFLVTGLAFGRLTSALSRARRALRAVDVVGGVLLLAFGLLLVTDTLHYVSSGVSDLLRAVGLGRLSVS
ncbi:MAG: cytochrome c biogenesis CcdA family protein [Acidimicrobiales bacterium]